jgi:hypothetical protein
MRAFPSKQDIIPIPPPTRQSLQPLPQPCTSLLPARRNRLDLKHSLQQILDHLILVLLARGLDLADTGLGFLVGFVFGGLVSLCVLFSGTSSVFLTFWGTEIEKGGSKEDREHTSASNFLNSASFCARYSSISFLASSRAALTRFVRSVTQSVG